jgi:hypothetical protein
MQEAIVFIATGLDEVAYRRALGTLQRPAPRQPYIRILAPACYCALIGCSGAIFPAVYTLVDPARTYCFADHHLSTSGTPAVTLTVPGKYVRRKA